MLNLIISFLAGVFISFIPFAILKIFKKDNLQRIIELETKLKELERLYKDKDLKINNLESEIRQGVNNIGVLSSEKISLNEKIDELKLKLNELEELERQNRELKVKNATFEEKLIGNKNEIKKLNDEIILCREELKEKDKKIDEILKQSSEFSGEVKALKVTNEEQAKNIKTINEVKKEMLTQFLNISNSVIKEQKELFSKDQKVSLENILNPLKEQMDSVKRQIVDVNIKNTETKTTIETTIKNLIETTNDIGSKADNLAKALKGDKKAQGNWGEFTLSNLLESMGLKKDLDYLAQQSILNKESERLILDFVINLPNNKKLIIDSKVSIVNYQKYIETDNLEEKKKYLNEYCKDIEQHIKELGDKNYQDLYGNNSLDFVFMFLPLENAYLEAINCRKELFNAAFKNKIAIVTASSLMPVLRMITHLWNIEKQNKNIEEIIVKVVNLYDKFAKFIEKFKNIENKLDDAKKSYSEAYKYLATGNANVIKTTEEIKNMIGDGRVKENIKIEYEN